MGNAQVNVGPVYSTNQGNNDQEQVQNPPKS